MNRPALLLRYLVLVALGGAAIGFPVRFGAADSTSPLCSEGKTVCVPASFAGSQISNPLRVEVQLDSPGQLEVAWELRDSAGQLLESSSTSEYPGMQAGDASPARTLRIQDFVFKTAASRDGILSLNPSRHSVAGESVALPPLKVPVRLATENTQVTTLEPENSDALAAAVTEWLDGQNQGEFNPPVKLIPRRVSVMRIDSDALIGVTAEAVLRSAPGQSRWHVTKWRQEGDTAHVGISGDGWAGVTYYLTAVEYLIRKSVLNLPGVRKIVFDPTR